MFSISLDWLSFTIPERKSPDAILEILSLNSASTPITPRFGYTWGRQSKDGVVLFGHATRLDMGLHILISGSALRALEASGHDANSLLAYVVKSRYKITRLDLAKDAQDEPIDLNAIMVAGVENKFTGTAQTCDIVKGNKGGRTLYVGSRKSERFARIYDKGAQTGTGENWLRYEFELKGDVARAIGNLLVEQRNDWNGVFGAMARSFFNVDAGGYEKWLEGESVKGLPKIEKRSDREKWIFEQVIPALTDHLAKNPDSAAIQALYYALRPYFEVET